ncbi:hypothetical protein ACLB2K_018279 [Fragaria x ananassa]
MTPTLSVSIDRESKTNAVIHPNCSFPDRTVASSASPGLTRRKPSSSSSSSSTQPGRVVGRVTIPSRASEPQFPFWQQTWFIALLLAMAVAFLCLAVFLFLGLDLDTGYAATTEGVQITYGSVLKLMHERTKFRLHSHDVPYGSGSGQQSVTGFPNVDDANSYWVVGPQLETSARQGDSIPSGTIIRLQHMKTRKWLHSHLHASPISGNQEVSCFGGENESDTGDHWRVMIEGTGKTWKQDQRVRLQHVDTGIYLHSHDKKYQRIAGGQQEVCGVRDKRADNVWLAAEGVYLPEVGGSNSKLGYSLDADSSFAKSERTLCFFLNL